jgi:diguanylate cyclase (GGDEF)-like protein/PAS domain S-box-containing protein
MADPGNSARAIGFGVHPEAAVAMLAHTRDAVVLTDGALTGHGPRILAANPAFARLTGHAAADLAGTRLSRMAAAATDTEQVAELVTALADGHPTGGTVALRRADGTTAWVEGEAVPVCDSAGTVYQVRAVLRDVTEQVRRQRLLAVAGSRAHELLAVANREGRIDWLEPMERPTLGHDPAGLMGTSVFELVAADDVAALRAAFDEPDTTPAVSVRLHHGDGSWRWVETHVRDHRADAALGGLVVAGREVSGREQMRAELARATGKLRLAVGVAGLSSWQLDVADQTITGDPQADESFLVDPDGPPLTVEQVLADIHPDEREPVRDTLSRVAREGGGFERTFRFNVNGQWRWMLARAEAVADTDGTITTIHGLSVDVTECHQATLDLTRTLEGLTTACVVLDGHRRVVFANARAEQLLGRPRDEAVGQPLDGMLPEAMVAVSERAHCQAMTAGEPTTFQAQAPPAGRWYDVRILPATHHAVMLCHETTAAARPDIDHPREGHPTILPPPEASPADEDTDSQACDALTGLASRAHVERRLEVMLAPGQDGVGVLCVDIDDFKVVNNSLGHTLGDVLLGHVAARLAHRARPPAIIGRFEGDKFVVALHGVDLDRALAVADHLQAAIQEPFDVYGHRVTLHASVGAAVSGAGATAEDVIRNADTALSQAKRSSRGHVAVYDERLGQQALQRLNTEAELWATRHGEQLELFYQPIFDVADGTRQSVEALLRWHHPTRGLLTPGAFIELAETTDLIVPIGAWVIDEAARLVAEHRAHDPLSTVWVNIAAPQLTTTDLAATVADAQQRHGLEPGELGLELTERVLLADLETATPQLDALAAMGVRLAIDDFGTGYSSMSLLQHYPLDTLKIDRAFTARTHTVDGAAIVRATVQLAHALNAEACAEGVETADELHAVRDADCDTAAGYLLAHPQPSHVALPDRVAL